MGNYQHVPRTLLAIEANAGERLLQRRKKKHRFRSTATSGPRWDEYQTRECRVRAILRTLTGLEHEWRSTRSLDWLKMPGGARNLEIDCWSPTLNTAVEVDGLHHRTRVQHWQSEADFKQQQERDKWKDFLCREQGVRLIRVPPRERLCDSKLVAWVTNALF